MDGGNLKRIIVPLDVNEKATPELNLVMIGGSKAKAHRQKDGTLILTPDNITDFSYEIPTLNSSFLRKKYKYSYGTKGDMKHTQGKFGKVDLETREVRDWGENGMYGSVLCYLPRPGATAEDDGTIIGTLLHSDDKTKVTLIVLNAADMTELARATFTTASHVPRSLHGCFVPA
ncbi:Beta,beta-carotene 15,15'-dioxygenase [Chionoecetes opilio]|uniref:Beta,beta-carotene 15,15'-dioxygenase n=1 Tax=Chionoecetes opilio TaxID=41210 RepID=A0A8J4Y564_CHIOP|nr:Beta,beta-carotene 15,15'-dioxygenase [Chionoecetes opilio]